MVEKRLLEEICRLHHLLPGVEIHLRSEAERMAHQRILDAVAAGDRIGGEEAIRDHLVESDTATVREFLEGRATL